MNWDDVRFFLATARTGQVTAAAQRLGVDQATVGRRVAQLERMLKTKLFDRSPRGYELTTEGSRLVPYAETIESQMLEAQEVVGGHQRALNGVIRIGAPEGIASHLIAPGAAALCKEHPQLEVHLVALPRTFSLSKREADFAIAVSRPTSGRLVVRKIADYKLHLYASRAYVEARPPIVEIADLKRLRGIGYISELIFDRELDYIPLINPELTPHLASTSIHVQLEWTRLGAGVCILPDFVARRHDDLVRLMPEQIALTRTFWMVVHEDNARLDRVRRCMEPIVNGIARSLHALGEG